MIDDYLYPELVTFVVVATIPLSLVILTKGRIPKDLGLWLILLGTAWISLGVLLDYLEHPDFGWLSAALSRPYWNWILPAAFYGPGALAACGGILIWFPKALRLQDEVERRKRTQDELHALNEELQATVVKLEEASQAKSEFLATMSHEFRTPLNAILGFSDIMRGQHVAAVNGEKLKEYADDIFSTGQHMLSLVEDTLDISAIEAGRKTLDLQPVEIPGLVEECVRQIERVAREKDVSVTIEVADRLPNLLADRRSLKQIAFNLLSNAVKYTNAQGTIKITADEIDGTIRLVVEDTGIGIPPERLSQVTEPFSQLHANPALAQDGRGLGLAIVQKLVDAHDGDLTIESEVGSGTSVAITFPPHLTQVR